MMTVVQSIVGGVIASSAVATHTVRLLGAGDNYTWRCSGVVVSSSEILTAAHCLPDDTKKIEVFYAIEKDKPFGDKAASWERHEKYDELWTKTRPDVWNPEKPVYDIGIIHTSFPLPKSPAGLWSGGYTENDKVVLVGFGATKTDELSIPKMREVAVPWRAWLKNSTEWWAGNSVLYDLPTPIGNPKGGCMGDSGGPAFIEHKGKLHLAGIMVRGPGKDVGGCESGITIVTDVSSYIGWINSKVRAP
jgi:V8-like Glu-specific endopeptidase